MSSYDGWKVCTVWGDMSSDSAADQYPQVNVCPGCIREDQERREDQQIVSMEGAYDPDYGPECYFCGECPDED